jgi:hypothetical protein
MVFFCEIFFPIIKLQIKILIKMDDAMCHNLGFNYSQVLILGQQSMRKWFALLCFRVSFLRFMYSFLGFQARGIKVKR